jgi:hypothetical protein
VEQRKHAMAESSKHPFSWLAGLVRCAEPRSAQRWFRRYGQVSASPLIRHFSGKAAFADARGMLVLSRWPLNHGLALPYTSLFRNSACAIDRCIQIRM